VLSDRPTPTDRTTNVLGGVVAAAMCDLARVAETRDAFDRLVAPLIRSLAGFDRDELREFRKESRRLFHTTKARDAATTAPRYDAVPRF
jgi:hypothetical protein